MPPPPTAMTAIVHAMTRDEKIRKALEVLKPASPSAR